MKSAIRKLIRHTARTPVIGRAYDLFGYIQRYSGAVYAASRHAGNDAAMRETVDLVARLGLSDLAVRHGPFAGLRFPAIKSTAGAFLPKLLGSYERELHGMLAGLPDDYATIVNIGCAEGYYAVGLARRFARARVYAFDTDPEARIQCLELARCNGVAERIVIAGRCDRPALKALDLGRRSLIFSDSEGYERELFDSAMAERLRDHDLIIETHDWSDIDTSTAVKTAFGVSHDVTSIYGVDDVQKVFQYGYPELATLSRAECRRVLTELRPYIMEWLVVRSRRH